MTMPQCFAISTFNGILWKKPIKLQYFVNELGKYITLSKNEIVVEFDNDKHKRRTSKILDEEIEKVWKEKCLASSKIFNGKKFRLSQMDLDSNRLKLQLGLTCYKDIIGISYSSNILYWQQCGINEANISHLYLSEGLGVGAFTVTSDNHVIVIKRAAWTGEYPCMFDRPGGHPEPEKIVNSNFESSSTILDLKVMEELWAAPLDELEAEVGINRNTVLTLQLMGTVRNLSQGGRPSLEFLVRVSDTAEEVQSKYHLGKHAEVEESTSVLLIIPKDVSALQELIHDEFKNGLRQNVHETNQKTEQDKNKLLNNNFTPALKGAFFMYRNLCDC